MKESIKTLFEYNNRLREIVESRFDDKFDMSESERAFIAFFFAKAYKTHTSIVILCDRANGQDAAILVRSLFELLVTAKYILQDETGDKLRRWIFYDWVIRQRWYEQSRTNEGLARLIEQIASRPKPGDNTIEEINREAEKAKEIYNYNYRFGWSDKSIADMSGSIGMGDVYKTVYRLTSDLHHSAVRTVNDYISKDEEVFKADTAPSDTWVEETLVSAFHFFLLLSGLWNDEFSLQNEDRLQAVHDEFVMYVKELNKKKDEEEI